MLVTNRWHYELNKCLISVLFIPMIQSIAYSGRKLPISFVSEHHSSPSYYKVITIQFRTEQSKEFILISIFFFHFKTVDRSVEGCKWAKWLEMITMFLCYFCFASKRLQIQLIFNYWHKKFHLFLSKFLSCFCCSFKKKVAKSH